jgi:hypothetical protein
MKTITVRLANDKHTEMLTDILKALNFVESVEVNEEDSELTEEEIAMVEERWIPYKKDPRSTVSWNTVKTNIRKKHGLQH